MVAIVSLRLLSGSDATSAPDIAPHTPPSTTICLHALAKNIGIAYWDVRNISPPQAEVVLVTAAPIS